MISGNMVGSYSQMGKTFIIQDENGNEITAVVTDQEQIFTATDNDVREGMTYASDSGISTGSKDIPAYRTTAGYVTVFPDEDFAIYSLARNSKYDYTELQCIITLFNTTVSDSVAAEKIVVENAVYNVGDTIKLADVVKDTNGKLINLNITNNSENTYLIRYFTYKEEV